MLQCATECPQSIKETIGYCQTIVMEFSAETIAFSCWPLLQKASSQVFDRVLNTPQAVAVIIRCTIRY